MYVSMNPSGETGKAIHISQDDTNREVEFIPYDQNGLVKTTSDETVAHINSIKGNTVSFNQLIQSSGTTSTDANVTFTNNNDGSWTVNGLASANTGKIVSSNFNLSNGHKYLFKGGASGGANNTYRMDLRPTGGGVLLENYGDPQLYTSTSNVEVLIYIRVQSGTNVQNKKFMPQIFDLTLMGIDNLTTTAEVEAYIISHLGNLDYFGFTLGTLIPFNGTGLKTTGKNMFDATLEVGTLDNNGMNNGSSIRLRTVGYIRVLPNTEYTVKGVASKTLQYETSFYSLNDFATPRISASGWGTGTFTTPSGCNYVRILFRFSDQTNILATDVSNVQLEIGSSVSATYEPYTSNTLSLPTSAYFPTGMKSIIFSRDGYTYEQNTAKPCDYDFYDLLVPTKATNLIDVYTFTGTETWVSSGQSYYADVGISSSAKKPSNGQEYATILHDLLETVTANELYYGVKTDGIAMYNNGRIYISSSRYANISSLTGTKLYYVLNTATETSISPELDLTYPIWNGGTEQILPVNGSVPITAPIKANITYPDRTEDTEFLYKQTSFVFIPRTWAFVCKNITQALTLVGNVLKGTIPSGMASESGKFPLKVKMTDEDGACFSEKIDLFVERKP